MGSKGPPGVRSETEETPLASMPKTKNAARAVIPGGRRVGMVEGTADQFVSSRKPHNDIEFSGERSESAATSYWAAAVRAHL